MMGETELDTSAIDGVVEAVGDLLGVDYMPLMEEWRAIMFDDNERFAKLGLDKDELPLKPVTYRPRKREPSTVDYTVLRNNNLTNSHYSILDGPPLAPRRQGDENKSRVIENFVTRAVQFDEPSGSADVGDFGVMAGWRDFLTPDDEEILPWHFEGEGNLPVRDLRGIRDSTYDACVETTREFTRAMLDRAFEEG